MISTSQKYQGRTITVAALAIAAIVVTYSWIIHDIQSQAVARGYANWCVAVPDSWAWKGECPEDMAPSAMVTP